MFDGASDLYILVLMIGSLVVVSMLIKSAFSLIKMPPLIGYLGLGIVLKVLDTTYSVFPNESHGVLKFLAQIGLITLLFHVGVNSDIKGLISQLFNASLAWVGNIAVTALAGFFTAVYLLHLSAVTSLIIGAAFTATSVGISVGMWENAGALRSPDGSLLLDLAELDDVSAIIIMALVFAVIPNLRNGDAGAIWPVMAKTSVFFAVKLSVFAAGCYLYSHYLEKPISGFFRRVEPLPDTTLSTIGIGFIIAALAGMLGFSLAIGAFFAGLVFSKDREKLRMETMFQAIVDLFSPFFFIGIGLEITLTAFPAALKIGSVLFPAAVASKIVGNALPISLTRNMRSGFLIGMSMVPRAEIAMVIMQMGLSRGPWVVSQSVYGGMILVSAGTCICTPFIVRFMLNRWPPEISI
jgi:Na+:H+ antiporter